MTIKFADTQREVERGTVIVKCLAPEHNTKSQPGLKPRLLDQELSILLTMWPPRLLGV